MAFFCFPNHILKLKPRDQPRNAGKESLLTRDITQLFVQRSLSVFCQNRNRKQLMFFHMPCKVWCKVFDIKFVITIKKINLIIFSRVEGSEFASHLSSGSAGFSTEGRSKSWNRVSSPRFERRASIQGSWVF